ncbi:pectinesterase inhibitor 12-like [Alnus glutinosa]|uniref:pectinesterase inhibitor 12-like n=1 Tax=Alnus glutinosa TaxID=3517 RepID=UPI002D78440B|nr:pectinesterase inhibitor 12-like [Alnus glutinosa]
MNTIPKVFLVLLVTLWPSQILAGDLISSACDHTLYKQVCRQTLQSDPESRAATSFEVLAKVALKHATSKATQIHDQVTKLLNGSSSAAAKGALTDCDENYEDSIEKLKDSATALASKRYSDVNTWVSAAMSAGDSCDEGFKEVGEGQSPLGNQGTLFTRLCSIVLAITNQLK